MSNKSQFESLLYKDSEIDREMNENWNEDSQMGPSIEESFGSSRFSELGKSINVIKLEKF